MAPQNLVNGGGLLRLLSGTFTLTFKMLNLCSANEGHLADDLGEILIKSQRKIYYQNVRIARWVKQLGVVIPRDFITFAALSSIAMDGKSAMPVVTIAEIEEDHRQIALDIETLSVILESDGDEKSHQVLADLQDILANSAEQVRLLTTIQLAHPQ